MFTYVCNLSEEVQKKLLNRVPEDIEDFEESNLLEEKILLLHTMDICSFDEMMNLRNKGQLVSGF